MSNSTTPVSLESFIKPKIKKSEIDYIECRFVTHVPKKRDMDSHDWLVAKEFVHLKDGTTKPHIRYWKDRPYSVHVTRTNRRTYTQKKEYESLDDCVTVTGTQSDINYQVARALDDWSIARNPWAMRDSPWVYGADVPATVHLKHDYRVRLGDKPTTPFSVGYSDTETDINFVFHPTKSLVFMESLYFDGVLYTWVVKDFYKRVFDKESLIKEKFDQYMPKEGKDDMKDWKIYYVDRPIDVVRGYVRKAHELMPDILAFWNMIFDWDKMVETIEDAGLDVAQFMCDENMPEHMRYYSLKRDRPYKMTASGKRITKPGSEQWHTVFLPTPFVFIDQMATYRLIRKAKPTSLVFNLDAILDKELNGLSKLWVDVAKGLRKNQFHEYMQANYPVEYTIYHAWDVVCMKVLNDKTRDLTYSLPSLTGDSEFTNFNSEPTRYVHDFHFTCLAHNATTGVGGKAMLTDLDKLTINPKGHIITLEPHLMLDTGMMPFADYPGLLTLMHSHGADLDVKSSYPYGQWVYNMGKTTTVRELCEIYGIPEIVKRQQGLNFSGGPTNSIEFCTEIYHVPTMVELSKLYDEAKKI